MQVLALAFLNTVHQAGIWMKQKLNMAHTISQQRADFLEEHFVEFSFEERTPNKSLFDTITSPPELHYLAHIYNWDDGAEVLSWIINSPYCDRGTAALVFWRSQPEYYTQITDESETDWATEVYLLLRRIIQNWESGFYARATISYDPRDDAGAPRDINERNPEEKWPIPAYLKEPTKGQPFLFV